MKRNYPLAVAAFVAVVFSFAVIQARPSQAQVPSKGIPVGWWSAPGTSGDDAAGASENIWGYVWAAPRVGEAILEKTSGRWRTINRVIWAQDGSIQLQVGKAQKGY